MRSLLFNLSFYLFTGAVAILSMPMLLAPTRGPLVKVIQTWSKGVLWLMRTVAGIRVDIRGREHIPSDGPALIAAKHQSECDGIVILSLVPDPAWLVKAVGAFGLVLSPVYYILNLWAVTRLVDDPEFRPGRVTSVLAVAGILAMTGTAVLLLWTTF